LLILACVALALLAAAFTRGRLSRLAAMRWRNRWLLPLALAAQTAVVEIPAMPRTASAVIHVLTYLLAAAFLWSNRHVKGLWLICLGAASNGVTIALNGGTLPASPEALRMAGIHEGAGFVNSGPVHHPVLGWLGDIFATPHWFPLANVFSIGDVLVVAGAVWLIHTRAPRHAAVQDRPTITGIRPTPWTIRSRRHRTRFSAASGEDEVLTPVDEFSGRVEMAGVTGGLGQDGKDRGA
jgi:hypothetical protein